MSILWHQLLLHDPFVLACALVLSASLLWLGSRASAAGRLLPEPLSSRLGVVAMLLAGTGLWWPGHLMAGASTLIDRPGLRSIVAWVLAVALVRVARTTASAAGRHMLRAAGVGAMATLLLVVTYALLAAPAAFYGWGAAATWVSAGFVTAITGLLALLLGDERSQATVARMARGAAALIAALLLLLGSATGAVDPNETSRLWPGGLGLAGMALVATMLLAVLRHEPRRSTRADERRAAAEPRPTDSLTQLPTRAHLEEQLAPAVVASDRSGRGLALLFIDLDGFRTINDTFGHSSGDRVLEQVSRRLRSLSRAGDVVARVGGDEFLLLLKDSPTQEAAAQIATRLIDELSRGYDIDGRDVAISCSVGIVLYPDGGDHRKLIARAEAAMFAAKHAGGSTCRFYAPEMDANVQEQLDLLRDLRQALERNEMELYYQPKIDAHTGKVTAAEALLRWKHSTRGFVSPGIFIPVAERFRLIGSISDWVIEEACRQARQWRESGLRMRVAINLSAQQMRQPDLVQSIENALDRHRIHPSLITCEITESVAMEDTQATQDTFRRLGELGVHLSIDDFGTGYSSLSYLRKLPAAELKIDRSFVTDVETSPDARAIVDAVVKLAHALGLRVVAEGVENTRQQQILVEMGCDELQGYLFARPMTARALLLWAMEDRPQADVPAFNTSLFGETVPTECA